MNTLDEYTAQIHEMAARARDWQRVHPGRPKIQFNHQNKSFIIGTVQQGIDRHYISCDAEGLALVAHVTAPYNDTPAEPTIAMLRIALDTAFK